MKKIIALALALIMALSMGSVAFAAHQSGANDCEVATDDHLLPGETYELYVLDNSVPTDKDYKVSVEWTKGGALVKNVSWDKDFETDAGDKGAWVMELKENFTITEEKALVGTITFKGKGDNKGTDIDVDIDEVVANHLVMIDDADEDLDYAPTYEAEENTVYQCEEDCPGYVKFNDGRLLGLTVNLVSEEKVYLANNEDMIDALAEKYPDAELECYSFGSTRTLKNAATLTLQADYADQYYVYTYENGKLAAQDYEWDSVEGVYTWETKTLTSYVLSDVELVAAAEETTKNPDTGANDVVGVAAALAVVSLVAAGAVSLKK